MGHYASEMGYYDEDDRRKQTKKASLELMLSELQKLYLDHRKGWSFSDARDGEKLLNNILTNIKAELYDLRNL